MEKEIKKNKILFIDFNQTSNYLAVGLTQGFDIFRIEPFSLCFHRDIKYSISIIKMCYETNIIAFVGNKIERNPRDAIYNKGKNKDYKVLSIWNDDRKEIISQLTFHSKINNLFITKKQFYVIFKRRVYIYNLLSYENIDIIQTFENPKGYFGITETDDVNIVAYFDKATGFIRLRDYMKKTSILIKGNYDEPFSFLVLNSTGQLLGTANKEGTTLYIFNTGNGKCLQELKRGIKKADILSICFDENEAMISAVSHKGTLHIWSTLTSLNEIGYPNQEKESNQRKSNEVILPQNKISVWKKFPISSISSRFQTERGFAQMHLPHERTICAFNPNEKNQIIAVSESGIIYIGRITDQGGECHLLNKHYLFSDENNNK